MIKVQSACQSEGQVAVCIALCTLVYHFGKDVELLQDRKYKSDFEPILGIGKILRETKHSSFRQEIQRAKILQVKSQH